MKPNATYITPAIVAVAASVALSGASVSAQTQQVQKSASATERALYALTAGAARSPHRIDHIRADILSRFERADIDGGGVGASDAELEGLRARAALRATQFQRWLRHDLDGDMTLEADEMRRSLFAEARAHVLRNRPPAELVDGLVQERIDALIEEVALPDLDGNGVATFEEMVSAARSDAEKHGDFLARQTRRAPKVDPAFDLNADGLIERRELIEALDPFLAMLDQNGDGFWSHQEIEATDETRQRMLRAAREEQRREVQEAKLRETISGCGLPPAREGADVVVFGTGEMATLADITLSGEDDVTHFAEAVIEPGERPLYLLARSGDAIIWRLSGAVDRVVQVAGIGERIGWMGLPDRTDVAFASPTCAILQRRFEAPNDVSFQDAVEIAVGKRALAVVADDNIERVSLPSGRLSRDVVFEGEKELNLDGPAGRMWRTMLYFSPGGFVELDPEGIVSKTSARRLAVPPQQAGLAVMLERGELVLEENANTTKRVVFSGGDVIVLSNETERLVVNGQVVELRDAVRPEIVVGPFARLRIMKKTRIPTGLYGAHSVTFVLPEGVPDPDGHLGHSKIIRE